MYAGILTISAIGLVVNQLLVAPRTPLLHLAHPDRAAGRPSRPRPHDPALHLNAFLMGVGHHEAAWRHPAHRRRARVTDVRHFQELARTAERGTLDSVFFADGSPVGPNVRHNLPAGSSRSPCSPRSPSPPSGSA